LFTPQLSVVVTDKNPGVQRNMRQCNNRSNMPSPIPSVLVSEMRSALESVADISSHHFGDQFHPGDKA